MSTIRNNWTVSEINTIYHKELIELMFQASSVHQEHHTPGEVQLCTLLSVKTGGCSEDCSYCPQSARYNTGVKAEKLLTKEEIVSAAKKAKEKGSSRFCMGAAWKKVRDTKNFDEILDSISAVNELGLEVCCTLGMLTEEQAVSLKEAGTYAYNHNLDTSREFYPEVISTRTYDDRLKTLENIRKAGMTVCCGGILGLGETDKDRVAFLHSLATLSEHPESVPVNTLVAIPGTPLEKQKPVPVLELVRVIATARIIMPKALIRLSAGRKFLTESDQALCFMVGANSIHTGERLLTQNNCGVDKDQELVDKLGLTPMKTNSSVSKESAMAGVS